jgi:hypothetical protein
MEQYQRDDGDLIIGAFRDIIVADDKKQARHDISMLAETHGSYMRVIKVDDSWRAAVSESPGYLLAECVADALSKENILYLEEYTEGRCILIVIKGGVVIEDVLVPRFDVREIAGPHFLESKFHIFTSGDVPIYKFEGVSGDDAVFAPPEDYVESRVDLGNKYRNQVALTKNAQLVDWKRARAKAFGTGISPVAIVGLLVIAAVIYMLVPKQETKTTAAPPDPLGPAYIKWSSGMSLSHAMSTVADNSLLGLSVTGWSPVRLLVSDGGQVTITVQPTHINAAITAVRDVFDGNLAPVNDTRNLDISIRSAIQQRDRSQFEIFLNETSSSDSSNFVDSVSVGPWGLNAIARPLERGIAYVGHEYIINGTITPIALKAAAKHYQSIFRTIVVRSAEYTPLDGKLQMQVVFYVK